MPRTHAADTHGGFAVLLLRSHLHIIKQNTSGCHLHTVDTVSDHGHLSRLPHFTAKEPEAAETQGVKSKWCRRLAVRAGLLVLRWRYVFVAVEGMQGVWRAS